MSTNTTKIDLSTVDTWDLLREAFKRPEIIALKIWSNEDVKQRLHEMINNPECKYADLIRDNFDVIAEYATHYNSDLEECTEHDWDIIDQQINDVLNDFNPTNKKED